MKHYYIDEKTGIRYILQGDYYLPDLALPNEKQREIGLWGRQHLRHIKQYQRLFYTNLLTNGKLNRFLADIDKQAEEMLFLLAKQIPEREA